MVCESTEQEFTAHSAKEKEMDNALQLIEAISTAVKALLPVASAVLTDVDPNSKGGQQAAKALNDLSALFGNQMTNAQAALTAPPPTTR